MFVRLLALLLAIGMLVISAYSAPELTSQDATVLVEETDDLSETIVIESPAVLSDQSGAHTCSPAHGNALGRRSEVMIFRPPRVAAFV